MNKITDSTLNNHAARRKYMQNLFETSVQDKMTISCMGGGKCRKVPYKLKQGLVESYYIK